MAEAFREWLSAWDEWHVAADEYREIDGERVLTLTSPPRAERSTRPRSASARSRRGIGPTLVTLPSRT
jgi:hypothetical protein